MEKKLTFKNGITDGLPICIGYFSVAIAFGVLAVQHGWPLWAPALMSATNLSGTGQFAAIDLLSASSGIMEIALATLIINARYFLMSVSLSQKLPEEIGFLKRLIIAFGNTDENFAVAMSQKKKLNFTYLIALILTSFTGWFSGTLVGTFAGNIVPQTVSSALGISLYAMFLAIIIPPSKESKPVLFAVIISAIISAFIYWMPQLSCITSGWSIIICGILSSAVAALFFPVKEDFDE